MACGIVLRPCIPCPGTSTFGNMPAAVASHTNVSLGSLVFHCEVEEPVAHPCDSLPAPIRSKQQQTEDKEKLSYLSSPANIGAGKLLRDVHYFVTQERDPDAILLATKLSAVGYTVNVRTALGGGSACFRNLRHEFLTVRGHGEFSGVEYIVEPRFREHFLIPHPTDEYSEMLSHAPDVFVGTGTRLMPIVQILCGLMAESFEQKGLTLPPWRRTQAMLSKWLPMRARDTSFNSVSAPPHPYRDAAVAALEPSEAADHPATGTVGAGPSAAVEGQVSNPPTLYTSISGLISMASSRRSAPQPHQRPGGQQPPHSHQQSEWQALGPCPALQQTAATATPPQRDEYDAAGGFVPFGGCGGCSSDTEDVPSLPSPEPEPSGMPPCAAGQAACAPPKGGGGGGGAPVTVPGSRGRRSSLLAAHLHGHVDARGIQTRPPAHWGETPIHTVRVGFRVAGAAAGAEQQQQQQQLQQQQLQQQQLQQQQQQQRR